MIVNTGLINARRNRRGVYHITTLPPEPEPPRWPNAEHFWFQQRAAAAPTVLPNDILRGVTTA